MFLVRWWGDTWHLTDGWGAVGYLLGMVFFFLLSVAIYLAIMIPVLLFKGLRAILSAQPAYVTPSAGYSADTPAQFSPPCPHCGNTESLDIRPCIRCGQ